MVIFQSFFVKAALLRLFLTKKNSFKNCDEQAQALFEIKFKPNKIAAYRGVAQCRYGADLEYTRRISLFAESHFPQISLEKGNQAQVDFGIVANDSTKTKVVKLYNRTPVRARFMIKPGFSIFVFIRIIIEVLNPERSFMNK